jgi:hypothetical protein
VLNFDSVKFYNDPYVFGLATDVFDPPMFNALVETWPSEKLFAHMGGGYHKYSLSERNNAPLYHRFISENAEWREFHHYIKTAFMVEILAVLQAFGHAMPYREKHKARFEFSSLPADGGFLLPHTDIPSKVLTLVIPIYRHRWQEEWGGATQLLRPNAVGTVEYKDYQTPLDKFDIVNVAPYRSNGCLIFLKSDHSWHNVGPLKGPAGVWRRSLTVNLERVL